METPGGGLEGAIAGVGFPAYVIDSDGVIRWINDAAREIVGDVEGQDFTSLVAPEDRRRAVEFFAKKIAGTASATDGVFTVVGRNDARAQVEVSSVPLRRGDQVIGVFGLVPHRAAEAGFTGSPGAHSPAGRGAAAPRARTLHAADRRAAPPEHGDGAQPHP